MSEIRFGQTIVRIRHRDRNQYMTIAVRENWPAAKLGNNHFFYFILHGCEDGVRIQALQTPYEGYEWLYSTDKEDIYFDLRKEDLKQMWLIDKCGQQGPLRHGSAVIFRSALWRSSPLVYTDSGDNPDIFCLTQPGQEWILEVVNIC